MTTDNFADVGDFHKKFDLHFVDNRLITGNFPGPTSALNSQSTMEFRIKFLQEEFDEFVKGHEEGDVAQMADALVDLVYVALGTAHLMGLPWAQLWDDVQRANMTKERAAADGSNSKRGSALDVIKPEGWVGPNTEDILADYGFYPDRLPEGEPTADDEG